MKELLRQYSDQFSDTIIWAFFAFVLALALTPVYTYFAYKYKFWKRQRSSDVSGKKLEVFNKLHAKKISRHIPTMAGLIFVIAVAVVTLIFNLDRGQTWLPLAALAGGAFVGLIDDILNVFGNDAKNRGLRAPIKFATISIIGLVLGWFFFAKLGYSSVHIPYIGDIEMAWLIVPLFALVVVATGNAVNISDGLDGLAGGLAASAFAIYGTIALLQGNYGIAGFCYTVTGALLAYLWFNIYPARFFMGDVGSFALGTSLGVVAMLTNTLFLLPFVAAMFVVEAGSSLLQIFSKKVFHRKIFISAPIHHHLEAKGWPEPKITMRFWVLAIVAGVLSLVLWVTGGAL
ncbi:MAG: phospho-N-acetylmuramoyl-pentapeptide-transferase [Candidatus Nomurabacteria bacterium]|jgi:phospho-N-acetylmuramoyl-pentapeptide-transferase|nr:phospho-N-acetylmuramoyl-pentapeptide-transferase [Candidatus Nomurabacteria bacterium]